jgi:hypothetical protein
MLVYQSLKDKGPSSLIKQKHYLVRLEKGTGLILKVHKRENFFGSDFELYTFL